MKEHRIKPGNKIDLSEFDPSDTGEFKDGKMAGLAVVADLTRELGMLQEMLYAGRQHKVLVILQAMDTGGKDGAIKKVFEGVNPQGVRVASFGVPTRTELEHDYLWRAHLQVPARGEMVIFNRSYYEDVLIVRVHELVPPEIWKDRYAQINAFEEMLTREGTTILKFFLHISKEEQKKRLQARLDDETKHWKFNPADLPERKFWDAYMKAYEEALSRTSTDEAPWYIVPSDKKWYRNLTVSALLVGALEALHMEYPKGDFDPRKIVIE